MFAKVFAGEIREFEDNNGFIDVHMHDWPRDHRDLILIVFSHLILVHRIEADLISHEEKEDSSVYSDTDAEASETDHDDSDPEDDNGFTKIKKYTGSDGYRGFKAVLK